MNVQWMNAQTYDRDNVSYSAGNDAPDELTFIVSSMFRMVPRETAKKMTLFYDPPAIIGTEQFQHDILKKKIENEKLN